MTYEEAAFCLQQTSCGDCPKFYECREECNCSRMDSANKLAIKAIKKQISILPKKVEEVSFLELDNGSRYEILSLCPGCSVPFIGCIPEYCSACGQAIDGGEE